MLKLSVAFNNCIVAFNKVQITLFNELDELVVVQVVKAAVHGAISHLLCWQTQLLSAYVAGYHGS
jgi:hypothetical protein